MPQGEAITLLLPISVYPIYCQDMILSLPERFQPPISFTIYFCDSRGSL